jgi:hypothetical protein
MELSNVKGVVQTTTLRQVGRPDGTEQRRTPPAGGVLLHKLL